MFLVSFFYVLVFIILKCLVYRINHWKYAQYAQEVCLL